MTFIPSHNDIMNYLRIGNFLKSKRRSNIHTRRLRNDLNLIALKNYSKREYSQ
jgi:hypothetical protein